MTDQSWGAARTFSRRVRSFFDAPPDANAAPLELLQAALDELETKVQPSGRGARVFPYNRVIVTVTQPAADRAAIEAVFGQLDARLRERLKEVRCETPAGLTTSVVVADTATGGDPVLRVDCSNDSDAAAAAATRTVPELRLRVMKGESDRGDYTFTGGAVSIGRGALPADALGRVRRNDVAFGDARDGVTETVARAHARLEFDPVGRAYLLFNESSTNPTFLLRGGRSLGVAARDRRGVRVVSGDEIQLGRAIVSVTITEGASREWPPLQDPLSVGSASIRHAPRPAVGGRRGPAAGKPPV